MARLERVNRIDGKEETRMIPGCQAALGNDKKELVLRRFAVGAAASDDNLPPAGGVVIPDAVQ